MSGANFRGDTLWTRDSAHNDIGVNLSNSQLVNAIFCDANLTVANFIGADLSGAKFNDARLVGADFSRANLSNVDLDDASLPYSVFSDAKFERTLIRQCNLENAEFHRVHLSGSLYGSNLSHADFTECVFEDVEVASAIFDRTIITRSSWAGAHLHKTIFVDVDFIGVTDLDRVIHYGPSYVSLDTLFANYGKVPDLFWRGCGVPDDVIDYLPSFSQQPIQFESCFISHSNKDEEFTRRLFERMRASGLRVWYAPEDGAGGKKLHEQIERAIQMHDRLLIVLSENSLKSEWVMTEIRNARQEELRRGVRKLFPIRLVDFDTIRQWKCFDPDTGKDLAVEVREYLTPDFSGWKDHDTFEVAFEKLLRDLKVKTIAK